MKKRSFLLQNIVLILMSVYSIMMSIVAINSNYYNGQKLLRELYNFMCKDEQFLKLNSNWV